MSDFLEGVLSVAMLAPMDDPNDATCKWGAPVLLEGSPGIGKSGMIKQAARSVDLPLEVVLLGTRQPEDMSGAPMVKNGEVSIECILPAIRRLTAMGKGLLFLDELSCARPATQGAGLGVLQERCVGDTQLDGSIRVFAAANPADQSAGGWRLSAPMENRLVHFKVGCPSDEEWLAYMLRGKIVQLKNLKVGEARVREKWNESWSLTLGLMAGFLKNMRQPKEPGKSEKAIGNILFEFPSSNDRNREHAWASPRSWDMALRLVATCNALADSERNFKLLGTDFVRACVGDARAVAWAEWVAHANLPDPMQMLQNGWEPDKRRLDIAHAAYSAATAFALGIQDKAEQRRHVILAFKLLTTADKHGLADIVLAPAKSLMEAGYRPSSGNDKELTEAAAPLTKKFGSTGLAAYAVRK